MKGGKKEGPSEATHAHQVGESGVAWGCVRKSVCHCQKAMSFAETGVGGVGLSARIGGCASSRRDLRGLSFPKGPGHE